MENEKIIYNDKEYSLKDLVSNLDPYAYANSRSWSNKKRQKFFTVYLDIINSGITGGKNNILTTKMQPENYAEDDDMYGYVANYILGKMRLLSPLLTSEEREEAAEKTKYANNHIFQYLNNKLFGGRYKTSEEFSQALNTYFDTDRDETTGARGNTQRRLKISSLLNAYKNYINLLDFDFSESAYEDKKDLLDRISNAITALSGEDASEILSSLLSIGIDPDIVISNGLNDPYVYIDSLGQPVTTTYGEYYRKLTPPRSVVEEVEPPATIAKPKEEPEEKPKESAHFSFVLNKPNWDNIMAYKYTDPKINRTAGIKLGTVRGKFNQRLTVGTDPDNSNYIILRDHNKHFYHMPKSDIDGIRRTIRRISRYSDFPESKLKEMGWLKHGGSLDLAINNFLKSKKWLE